MIVGLGNPGEKYLFTPHNIGWIVVDALASAFNLSFKQKKSFLQASIFKKTSEIILIKPLTFMNLSGQAVGEAMREYSIKLSELLVVQDDLDLPFLSIKFQKNRGAAGHNGIRSIHQELNSPDYNRMRIGVAAYGNGSSQKRDVLKPFSEAEKQALSTFLNHSTEALKYYIFEGLGKASNQYNTFKFSTIASTK